MAAWMAPAATALAGVLGFAGSRRNTNAGLQASANLDAANRQWQTDRYWEGFDNLYGRNGGADRAYTIGADELGRERDLRDSGRRFQQALDVGQANGLTPQEIMGSPVPGGTSVSGGGGTLGNNQSALDAARMQQGERNADRQLQAQLAKLDADTRIQEALISSGQQLGNQIALVRGQDVSAGVQERGQDIDSLTRQRTAEIAASAQEKVGGMMAAASMYSADQARAATETAARYAYEASKHQTDTQRQSFLDKLPLDYNLNTAQVSEIYAQTAILQQDAGFNKVLHQERWERLFAGMSAENVAASVLAVIHGVDVEGVLKGQRQGDNLPLHQFLEGVAAQRSHLQAELRGGERALATVLSNLFGVRAGGALTSSPVSIPVSP